jgi:F-type H+-transporting ATPase subunit delta
MASAVANRYGQALVEVVTRPGSPLVADKAIEELSAFWAVFQSSTELRNVLFSPAVPPAKKRAVLGEVSVRLGLSRTSQNFLYVVTDHRRLNLLNEMIAAVQGLLDERQGVVRAAVTSAQPASPEQQEALAARLGQLTGKQVRAQFAVDTALLGGAVARIGSTIYDGSVRGQLQALERQLASE